jgi:hypothetical protein
MFSVRDIRNSNKQKSSQAAQTFSRKERKRSQKNSLLCVFLPSLWLFIQRFTASPLLGWKPGSQT